MRCCKPTDCSPVTGISTAPPSRSFLWRRAFLLFAICIGYTFPEVSFMDPIRMAPRTLALDMTLRLDQMLDPASYYMTGYALPPLIVGLVTVMLGLLVLWRERAPLVSVAFWLLTVIGGIWLLSYVGIFTARYQPVDVWWAKIENVAVVFIPSVVYWFTLAG